MMLLRLAIPCLGQNGGAPWKVAQASEQLEAARRHRVLTRRQKKNPHLVVPGADFQWR